MAETFLLGERKTRPGVYFRREKTGASTAGAINGILAAIFQSDFGELNTVVNISQSDMNNLENIFGTGAAVIREGLLGGATTVRAVRVGSDDGICAAVKFKNPDTVQVVDEEEVTVAGAEAVEVSAKYPGDRAFTATIRTNLITDKRQLIIYDGTEIFTAVNFEAGGDEAQNLVNALSNNKFFTARKLNSGLLKDVVQAPLTGGKNPTATTADYSKGTEALESYRWNCIVADSDDAAVNGILTAFVKQSYETGHLGFACIGGKSSQSFEERISYAASCNDEKIIYVLNGWTSNDGTTYEGWRAACRIGGMIASVETNADLTHSTISDALTLIEPLTNGEISRAEEKGCLVLSLNADDQIQIDNAITTLITPDANQDEGWSKIKRAKLRFELIQRVNDTCDRLIGRVNNDSNGRATIMVAAQRIIDEMIGEGKLTGDSRIEEDSRYIAQGDSAWFLLVIGDVDSLEKIYLSYRFRFADYATA